MDTVAIATAGVGLLLIWSALRNVSPLDLVRSALDPERAGMDPDPIARPAGGGHPTAGLDAAGENVIGGTSTASKQGLAGLAEPLRSATAALLSQTNGRVHIVSGRRSVAEQVTLRKKHCGTTQYAIYDKPPGQCSPPTARPGQSKHQTGEAVDLGGDLALAADLGAQLGLHTPVSGEPWHFEVA